MMENCKAKKLILLKQNKKKKKTYPKYFQEIGSPIFPRETNELSGKKKRSAKSFPNGTNEANSSMPWKNGSKQAAAQKRDIITTMVERNVSRICSILNAE